MSWVHLHGRRHLIYYALFSVNNSPFTLRGWNFQVFALVLPSLMWGMRSILFIG